MIWHTERSEDIPGILKDPHGVPGYSKSALRHDCARVDRGPFEEPELPEKNAALSGESGRPASSYRSPAGRGWPFAVAQSDPGRGPWDALIVA